MKILGLPSLLASVAAIGVGAGLTYAVASLISGSPDDQRGSMQIATVTATATLDAGQETSTATPTGTALAPTATAPFTGLLLDRKRDRLAICVGGVGVSEDDVTGAKTAVEGSLQRLSSDRIWIRVGLSNPPPVVEAGCPSAPAVYSQRNKDHPDFP